MKATELMAYANGAIDGFTKGTEHNFYDPETHAAEHNLYRLGYDYGVALYCQELEEGATNESN